MAILLVVGSHAGVPLMGSAGQVGVTIFFALSGFLITSILLGERSRNGRVDLRRFYQNRVLRLVPALVAMLLVSIPMLIVTVEPPDPWAVIPPLFYFANWTQVAASQETVIVGHTWSLSIEEQFYAVWPVAVLMLAAWVRSAKWAAVALCITAAAVMVERNLLWEPTREAYYRVFYGADTRADAIVLGAAVAYVFSWRSPRIHPALLVGCVAAITTVAVLPSVGFLATLGFAAVAAASCGLIAAGAVDRLSVMTSGPIVWVGLISYGLYLWHVPMLHLTRSALGEGVLSAVLGVALAFVAAGASRKWVELPARRFRRRT